MASVGIWVTLAADYMSEITIAIVTVIGSGLVAYLIAVSQGEKAAQKYITQEQHRIDHQKRIVNETREMWEDTLSGPRNVLKIEIKFPNEIFIGYNPFPKNEYITYFESHLQSGYKLLWAKIQRWKGEHTDLVKQTTDLAEETKRYVEELRILPKFDRLNPNEYIDYNKFLLGFFDSVSLELQGFLQFQIIPQESMKNDVKWYSLAITGYQYAESPNREKIYELKERVEEYHKQEKVLREFTDVFKRSEELNFKLGDIHQELRKVWAEVDNNVPLLGWCEAGIKGRYETIKRVRID
jgi:hypothetical protein